MKEGITGLNSTQKLNLIITDLATKMVKIPDLAEEGKNLLNANNFGEIDNYFWGMKGALPRLKAPLLGKMYYEAESQEIKFNDYIVQQADSMGIRDEKDDIDILKKRVLLIKGIQAFLEMYS